MTFKVLAQVVRQFWHVYWISYCKKNTFFSKGDILHRFVTINSGCKKL